MFQTYWNTLAFSPFVPGQTFSKIDSLLWILPYFFYISPKSPGFTKIRQYRQSGAQNRGFSAIGDLSPGPNSYRQLYVQNRGFGDISPEMLTLLAEGICIWLAMAKELRRAPLCCDISGISTALLRATSKRNRLKQLILFWDKVHHW